MIKIKYLFVLLLVQFMVLNGFSQKLATPVKEHVHVKASLSKTNVKKGDIIYLYLDVKVDEGWKLYSLGYECPPLKFDVKLKDSTSFQKNGELTAKNDHEKYDDLFECKYRYIEKSGRFVQKIKVLKSGVLTVNYTGQVCKTDGVCLMVEGTASTSKVSLIK